jgi:hypothetical protein
LSNRTSRQNEDNVSRCTQQSTTMTSLVSVQPSDRSSGSY